MAVIGCDIPVRQVVGAEKLADARAGIWTKTHFYQEGPYLHARTFLVAAGEPSVLEFRIDLRPLEKVAARIHQRLHEQMAQKGGGPVVGFSFAKAFKSIKNTAKKIGKTKLVKAVGGAIKTVAKSKIVGTLAAGLAVAVPVIGIPALAAYGTAKAAVGAIDKGKKLAHGAETARRTLASAGSAGQKLASAKAQAPARVQANAQAAQAQAKAQAASIAAKGKAQASAQLSIQQANAVKAQAAAKAKAALAAGQAKASQLARGVVAQVQTAERKVAPLMSAAAAIQAKLSDPAVRAKLTTIKAQADSAKKVLSDIQQQARHGTGAEKLDAQKSAAIVNLVAKNEARIQAMSQANAGGLPSLLIDARGRIVPGKFRVVAKTAPKGKHADVLYQGPKTATQQGTFAKVSGVPGIGADRFNWWTIEIKPPKSPRWISLQANGILFREHWEASKATDWYEKKGIPAKAKIVKYTPTPSEIRKSQNRIGASPGSHESDRRRGGGSPFPPPSPSDRRAKEAAYVEWLKKHAPRRGARVGWSPPPAWGSNTPDVGYSPPPAWATTIGCPCSEQGTEF